MTDAETEALRKKVALSCRILAMMGLVKETTGHVSARIDDKHIFVRGRGPDETALLFTNEEDVLRADLDGNIIGGGQHVGLPQEFPIHGEVYRARPEAGCVVHAHPPGILLCGITDLPLRPIFGAYDPSAMKIAIDGVPIYPHTYTLIRPELAQEMLAVMGKSDVCLLLGHGITCVGRTVEEATVKAIKMETLARITWHANQRGKARELSAEDLAEYAGRAGGSRGGSSDAVWRYYVKLLDHQGILPSEFAPEI
jgi:ribulose-5-phosphate 4-epimerase/fuculose-1-phosphate aldolase